MLAYVIRRVTQSMNARDYRVISQNDLLTERFGDLTGQVCHKGYMDRDEPCEACPLREALEGLRRDMIAGKGLSGPMEANPIFPSLMVQITKVGEEVGTLDEDMEVLAVIYTEEIENKINKFISLLQPTILMVMGLLVAFIAVSVVMPMYTVMQAV